MTAVLSRISRNHRRLVLCAGPAATTSPETAFRSVRYRRRHRPTCPSIDCTRAPCSRRYTADPGEIQTWTVQMLLGLLGYRKSKARTDEPWLALLICPECRKCCAAGFPPTKTGCAHHFRVADCPCYRNHLHQA